MKKFLIVVVCVILGVLTYKYFPRVEEQPLAKVGGSATPFFYKAATQATSTVNITSWTNVLAADSGRGYTAICNNGIVAGDTMFLGFGATSTKPYGFRLASGTCYEMTLDKMFYGNIFAISSTSTSTLMTVTGSFY